MRTEYRTEANTLYQSIFFVFFYCRHEHISQETDRGERKRLSNI